MKNLLIITEEEKNRILGLHESATKNQYLVNETLSANDMGTNRVSVDTQSQSLTLNNYLEIEDSRNLVGALELKLNKGVTFVRLSSDRLIAKNTPYQKVGDATGIVKTEGTNDIIYYCATKLFQVKGETEKYIGENFSTFVKKSFDQLCESIKVAAMPENIEAQVKAHAQYCKWGDDIQGFLDSGKQCPKPGSAEDNKGETPPPPKPKYYQEIINLQNKVGLENTGKLDQATLKAIMDKLSQKV